MIKTIRLFFVAALAAFAVANTGAQAQSSYFTADAGRVYSTFKFKDNAGLRDKSYSRNSAGSVHAGYRYVSENGLFLNPGIGVRNAETSLDYESYRVDWAFQYLDINLNVGYILGKQRVKPYLSVGPFYGNLMRANQIINSVGYDLLEKKAVKKSDFGILVSPGITVGLSDYVSLFGELRYIYGIQNLEKSAGQKTQNRDYSFNLGLAFTITCHSKTQQKNNEPAAVEPKLYQRTPEVDDALRHLRGIINKQ